MQLMIRKKRMPCIFCVYRKKERRNYRVCIQYPFITMEYISQFLCIIYRIVGGNILNIQTLSRMNWQTKWKRSTHIKRIGITHSKNYHTSQSNPIQSNPIQSNPHPKNKRVRERERVPVTHGRPVQNSICIRSFLGAHAFLNQMNCEWMWKITLKFSHKHSELRIYHRSDEFVGLVAYVWANQPTNQTTNHRPLDKSIQQQCV